MLEIDSPDKEHPRRDGLRGCSSPWAFMPEGGKMRPHFQGAGHRPAEPVMPSLFEREMRSKAGTERD